MNEEVLDRVGPQRQGGGGGKESGMTIENSRKVFLKILFVSYAFHL